MASMIAVMSSSLAAVGYDDERAELFVKFRHRSRTYVYDGVPPRVYEALLLAPSKGQFVASEIRDRYPYRRVA